MRITSSSHVAKSKGHWVPALRDFSPQQLMHLTEQLISLWLLKSSSSCLLPSPSSSTRLLLVWCFLGLPLLSFDVPPADPELPGTDPPTVGASHLSTTSPPSDISPGCLTSVSNSVSNLRLYPANQFLLLFLAASFTQLFAPFLIRFPRPLPVSDQ